jgi:hypothetical protein
MLSADGIRADVEQGASAPVYRSVAARWVPSNERTQRW